MTAFASKVLAHDPVAPSKVACAINWTAANEDWQSELDNDPGYIEWLENEAEIDNMRNARW